MILPVALRTTALLGTVLIFLGAFVSSIWDASEIAREIASESSWFPYASVWIGLILLLVVVAIALRTAESASRGSLEDAPLLAVGGLVSILAALFLFGGVIAAAGGIVLTLGGIAGALARGTSTEAESLK